MQPRQLPHLSTLIRPLPPQLTRAAIVIHRIPPDQWYSQASVESLLPACPALSFCTPESPPVKGGSGCGGTVCSPREGGRNSCHPGPMLQAGALGQKEETDSPQTASSLLGRLCEAYHDGQASPSGGKWLGPQSRCWQPCLSRGARDGSPTPTPTPDPRARSDPSSWKKELEGLPTGFLPQLFSEACKGQRPAFPGETVGATRRGAWQHFFLPESCVSV